jgi:hypothetical protein
VRNAFVRSTAAQFRLAAITQRLQTYERMWARTIEQMENGTYRRDIFKAKHRQKQATVKKPEVKTAKEEQAPELPPEPPTPVEPNTPPMPAKPESSLEASLKSLSTGPTLAKAKVPPVTGKPAAPVTKPPSFPLPNGAKTALNDTRLREVYDAYVMAKKRCNEDTSRLSYDSVASTLKKQVPELLKKHNARDVDFKVIIKDGKAVLKAVPKE